MNKVVLAQANLPFAIQTCYKMHSKKRVTWLTRTDPEGRRGRELWVDIQAYNAWAAPRGRQPIRRQTTEQGGRLSNS